MDADIAAELRAIAERVAHNVPHRRDPERFHIEKDDIARSLKRIARALDTKPALTVTRHSRARAVVTTEYINGRRVMIQRPRAPFAIFVEGRDL